VLYSTAVLNILHEARSFLTYTFKFYKQRINLHSSIFYVNHIFLSTAKMKAVSEYNQSRLFCPIEEGQCVACPQKNYIRWINLNLPLIFHLWNSEMFIIIRTWLCRKLIIQQFTITERGTWRVQNFTNLYIMDTLTHRKHRSSVAASNCCRANTLVCEAVTQ
jgi:hypothetical protein